MTSAAEIERKFGEREEAFSGPGSIRASVVSSAIFRRSGFADGFSVFGWRAIGGQRRKEQHTIAAAPA